MDQRLDWTQRPARPPRCAAAKYIKWRCSEPSGRLRTKVLSRLINGALTNLITISPAASHGGARAARLRAAAALSRIRPISKDLRRLFNWRTRRICAWPRSRRRPICPGFFDSSDAIRSLYARDLGAEFADFCRRELVRSGVGGDRGISPLCRGFGWSFGKWLGGRMRKAKAVYPEVPSGFQNSEATGDAI